MRERGSTRPFTVRKPIESPSIAPARSVATAAMWTRRRAEILEDFERGIAQRVGLSSGVGAALLGAWVGVQMLGLVLVSRGRRVGLITTLVAGAVWTAGAVWDHGPDLWSTGLRFRGSALSALWVVGLTLTQALAALFALLALMTGARTVRR